MIQLIAYKTLLLVVLGITPLVASNDPGTHDTPDGFVERAVAIIVRGRSVQVTYQVGINPKTMRDALVAWDCQEEFEDDQALTLKYCEILNDKILDGITLLVDDVELAMSVKSVEPFARHHKTAVVTLTAELPETDSLELQFSDTNFSKVDGAVRYAIKATSNTILTGSNAAPILQRAKRTELGSLAATERNAACQVKASLKFVTPKTK